MKAMLKYIIPALILIGAQTAHADCQLEQGLVSLDKQLLEIERRYNPEGGASREAKIETEQRVAAELCASDMLHPILSTPAVSTTALYDHGSYVIDGIVIDAPAHFRVDTGATVTIVPISSLALAGLHPVGTMRGILANGSEADMPEYIVPRLCVGPLCASDIRVLGGTMGLLGTDFLDATHAQVKIVGGVMTLTEE
jgi:hypothetical protein